MQKVHEFIINNWLTTVKFDSNRSPYSYTVPCCNDTFVNFFYWDTYFTNLGLLRDGLSHVARDNLLTMNHFVNKLGYIPNADHLLYRSQPPLFTRGVYDYVMYTGDLEFINTVKEGLLKEFEFFETHRKNPIGLYTYSSEEPKEGLDWYYDEFDRRLGGYNKQERELDKYLFARSLLGIAESGWDFNPRFIDNKVRFACYKFACLDLSCLLYDAFNKASELLALINDKKTSNELKQKADNLKSLINKYLYNPEDGIFYDYNFVDNKFSSVCSAASLYPYALGISKDLEGARKVFDKLILTHGISVTPFRGEDTYFQWDYPNLWPSNAYFAFEAMNNVGDIIRRDDIKNKYLNTIKMVFDRTGKLWEKYNSLTGDISVTNEYDTPTMMGWTAGVFEYFLSK